MTVTFEDFDMGVRTTVTDAVAVTISDRQGCTSGTGPLSRWSYRQATADTVNVRVAGAKVAPHTIPQRPAAGALKIGVQLYAVQPAPPYTTHLNYAAVLANMPARLDYCRVAMPWSALQPSSSAFGAEATYWDGFFSAINAAGLAVSLSVGTTPTWALTSGTDILQAPASMTNFENWVDAIIDRWGSTVEILYIEPWNEPNYAPVYHGTDAQMVQLIRACHTGAQGRVPTGTPAFSGGDWAYLQRLFDAGLTSADFDLVDYHPYPIFFTPSGHWVDPNYPPVETDWMCSVITGTHEIQRTLAANGVSGKALWISETGVSSNPRDDAAPTLRMTDARAAAWITTMLDQGSRITALEGISIHEATDVTTAGSSWAEGWGITRLDGTRRTKYASIASAP